MCALFKIIFNIPVEANDPRKSLYSLWRSVDITALAFGVTGPTGAQTSYPWQIGFFLYAASCPKTLVLPLESGFDCNVKKRGGLCEMGMVAISFADCFS